MTRPVTSADRPGFKPAANVSHTLWECSISQASLTHASNYSLSLQLQKKNSWQKNLSFVEKKNFWRMEKQTMKVGYKTIYLLCKNIKRRNRGWGWRQKCSHNHRQTSAPTHVHSTSHTHGNTAIPHRTDRGEGGATDEKTWLTSDLHLAEVCGCLCTCACQCGGQSGRVKMGQERVRVCWMIAAAPVITVTPFRSSD